MPLDSNDHEEIRQIIAKYCWALDFQDLDAFVDCFTEDGTFEGNSHRATLQGVHRGRDDLRAFAASVHAFTAGHVRHSSTNVLIDGDGDLASVLSYCQVTRDYGEPHGQGQMTISRIVVTGIYRDEFRRTPEGWRISRRTFRYDASPEILERVGRPLTFDIF